MYRLNTTTGEIICPDGKILAPPYDAPEYQAYAEWLGAGNKPEEFTPDADPAPAPSPIDLSAMTVRELVDLQSAVAAQLQRELGN